MAYDTMSDQRYHVLAKLLGKVTGIGIHGHALGIVTIVLRWTVFNAPNGDLSKYAPQVSPMR